MGKTEANRKYYLANKEKRIALNQELRKRNYDYVNAIKNNARCLDCKVEYPYHVMDFDHVTGDKVCNVSDMCRNMFTLDRIIAEIEKCELVCSNCHRTRTHYRRLNSR